MKAAEARQISEKGLGVDAETLKDAYTIIQCKASVGFTNTTLNYNNKTRTIVDQLRADGYKVKVMPDRNDPIIIVSW